MQLIVFISFLQNTEPDALIQERSHQCKLYLLKSLCKQTLKQSPPSHTKNQKHPTEQLLFFPASVFFFFGLLLKSPIAKQFMSTMNVGPTKPY
jgi:hypothetical protein